MRFLKITTTLYYNPKLGLGCNLGKDLSKDEGDDQLAKHKDIKLYLQLYILNEKKRHSWKRTMRKV